MRFFARAREIDAYKFADLKKFLLGKNSYQEFKTNITEDEVKELRLAKVTRNCFIHNNSKVDERWLEAFREARDKNSTTQIGDKLPVDFHQVEDWHKLILQIANKIKDTIARAIYS